MFSIYYQSTADALLTIFGYKSPHSLATGPLIALPLGSPFLLMITPALSSQ